MAKTLIKKNEVKNPVGRPKGSMNELKRKSLELRNRALKDIDTAYDTLWQAFEAKEAWAHQIFFKELVPFKKEWLNEVSVSDIPKEVKSVDDVNHVIAALSATLLQHDSIAVEEVHNIIKTLNAVKFTEQFGKQNNTLAKLSDEQVKTIACWIEEAEKNT